MTSSILCWYQNVFIPFMDHMSLWATGHMDYRCRHDCQIIEALFCFIAEYYVNREDILKSAVMC